MTTRQLIDFYAMCLAVAIPAGYYIGPIASVAAFVGTAILQTHETNTRRRP